MAWVAHQIVRDPVHLFDANIFYPERQTLAFSEHLFVQSMMAAPVRWAGGSAILAYNICLIAGFALTGWAMAIVMQRWTGSWVAGILSGSLMAFNAMTLTRLPHIQMQHMEFFPFALLALDRLLTTPRVKYALQLAAWYVLQSLTSLYFLVFTAIVLITSALVRPAEWLGKRARVGTAVDLLAGGVAVVALLPFVVPYARARSEQEVFVRTLPEVAGFAAQWTDYLATGGTLHNSTWSGQFFRDDGLFPGVMATVLVLVAVATGVAFKDRRARMAWRSASSVSACRLGPRFRCIRYLYERFPPMAGIRGAARFGQIFLAAVAILGGFGLAGLLRRVPGRFAMSVAVLVGHRRARRSAARADCVRQRRSVWRRARDIRGAQHTRSRRRRHLSVLSASAALS